MDELVFSCTDSLPQPATPACGTNYGERVVRVALMKEGGTFSVSASDTPTAAEFETAITAGEITVINGMTNGHRIEQGATELSGDDTESGGTERFDVEYRIEGRIKRVDETIARMTEKLDRYSTLRMWFFTEKNYCFGGVTGYKVSPNFSEVIFEGKGNPPYINFFCDYTAIGADYAGYDADYDTLDNS
jgi:hypothetical protein